MNTRLALLLTLSSLTSFAASKKQPQDPLLWLEDVQGQRALKWVDEQNAQSDARLVQDARFEATRKYLFDVYTDPDALAEGTIIGEKVYNFWKDAQNPRGLLRVTSLELYKAGKPKWETLIDIDQLSKEEKVSWYFSDIKYANRASGRALLMLSRDGRDAHTVREFDLNLKSFVKDGFEIAEAKSEVNWLDQDHLFVATDEGSGSLNVPGYPIVMRLLKRGTALKDAPVLYRGKTQDTGGGVYAAVQTSEDGTAESAVLLDSQTFEETVYIAIDLKDPANQSKQIRLPIPLDAEYKAFYKGDHIVLLVKGWPEKNLKAGTLIALTPNEAKPEDSKITVLYETKGNVVVRSALAAGDYLFVPMLKNVQETFDRLVKVNGVYKKSPMKLPKNLQISVSSDQSSYLTFTTLDFLEPISLHIQHVNDANLSTAVYREKTRFDASKFEVKQLKAKSLDGTMIPYFIVLPKKRNLKNAQLPVRISAYGGFNIAETPTYLGALGKVWLEDAGGAFVLANIRGGGEFGHPWHEAARVPHRNKAFEDLIAVGEDLIARKLADSKKISIEGGSNGGLLTSAVAVLRPDLFKAVVSQVPLTDMFRFHLLLAGASWMAEYGNPDDAVTREFWARYSPYQNVKAGVKYPEIFFTTSTADDRVHPGHARKMAAKLLEVNQPVIFFENREGGHGGAADAAQRAKVNAMKHMYLLQKLVDQPCEDGIRKKK